MSYRNLFCLLPLLVVVTIPVAAQGPQGGPVAALSDKVDALTAQVESLEARISSVESETGDQAAKIADLEIELERTVPAGTVVPFAGPVHQVPDGWLLCDGSLVSRSDFTDLFDVIGTTHGEGDGFSTFRLPDYRGMFLRGVDLGRGIDPDRGSRFNFPGGSTGDGVGSIQSAVFGRHGHSLGAVGLCDAGAPNGGLFPLVNILQPCRARTVSTAAGGNETRPVNVYVNFLIKE